MPTAQPPQPISAPANPSRPPARKMSTSNSALRVPTIGSRPNTTPMSFGAAMSGISFTDGGGFSFGNAGGVPGSYGARFYGDGHDSPHIPFSSSITMDPGSFAASSAAFGLPIAGAGSYTRGRSYAMAVSYGKEYNANALSASLASLTTGNSIGLGSLGYSYSRSQLETLRSLRNHDNDVNQDYECCGIHHNGLHALLEHVEDQHPYNDSNMPDAGFSPVTLAMDLDLEGDGDGDVPSASHSNRSSTSPRPMANYPLTPTSATGPKPDPPAPPATIAPLQLSDVLKSPPTEDTALALPSTSPNLKTPVQSSHPSPTSPFGVAPKITQTSRNAFLSGPAKNGPSRFDRAFNEVVAGKAGSTPDSAKPPGPTAVAPGVLFTAAAAMGIPSAPSVVGRQNGTVGNGSAPPPPPSDVQKNTAAAAGAAAGPSAATAAGPLTAGAELTSAVIKEEDKSVANGGAERPKAPEPQLPQPSLFTTHKAWRCPNPGCNKAYKQSNGLKYHLQKGQCDFAIHDAIDHGLTLEEAEERSRPYVCAVGAGCTKRYRQMNGLKYHYLNSGEHGEYGLRMLQNGTHPHPPSHPPVPKRDRTGQANMREAVRNGAAPYAVPGAPRPNPPQGHTAGGAAPRMGTWPTPQRPANGAGMQPTTTATTTATVPAGAAGVPARPPIPGAPVGAAAAAPRAAVPAAATAPKMMAPVQRGRDAVLFANVDPLDV